MMRRLAVGLAWILGILAVEAAAGQTGSAAAAGDPELAPFVELAQRLESSLSVCEPDLLDESFAIDLVVARGLRGLEVEPALLEGFVRGVRQSARMGVAVCQQVEAGGSYKLLRVRKVDGKPQALFRLLLPGGGGVNYHDMMLARLPGSGVQVIDIYLYLAGEWFSQTLRRALLPVVAQQKKGFFEKLLSRQENVYLANVERIKTMAQQAQGGQAAEALAVFKGLPPELQRDKTVLLTRMLAAQQLGEAEYRAALEDIKKAFPDDPAIGLTLIDYHFFREEYGTALELVERLDKALGGDPYLNVLRASCHLGRGRLDEAWKAASLAIRQEPKLQDGYWTAITVTLKQENYDETARLLTLVTERLGLEIQDLTQLPEYAGFVASPAYRSWIKKR